jgi:Rieske Fe-S protein
MKSNRSYVLGVRVADDIPRAMFYNTDRPCHYTRTQPVPGGSLIIIGGEDHQTGHAASTVDRYKKLEEFVRGRFNVKSIDYSWSTQDNYPFDSVPFIGKIPGSRHIYVATGFKGSGMTYGTIAAMVLVDAITGRENPWQELYDPHRVNIKAEGGELISNTAQIAAEFIGDRISKPKDIKDMANGEGAIAEVEGDRLAVFKDDLGKIHAVKPACAHMGCIVSWNDAERSWDCPCHGSRYDYDGPVLHSPTVKDLKKVV